MEIELKIVACRVFRSFYYDLTYGPTFYRTWPIFKTDLDFVKAMIQSKFHEYWVKIVASNVFTIHNPTWPSQDAH